MYNFSNRESYDLQLKLEKQASRIALLEDELFVANQALEEKTQLAAALEQDLVHTIDQLRNMA